LPDNVKTGYDLAFLGTNASVERLNLLRPPASPAPEIQPKESIDHNALRDHPMHIEKRKRATPRAHVMGAYLASHEKFGPLYKKLAE